MDFSIFKSFISICCFLGVSAYPSFSDQGLPVEIDASRFSGPEQLCAFAASCAPFNSALDSNVDSYADWIDVNPSISGGAPKPSKFTLRCCIFPDIDIDVSRFLVKNRVLRLGRKCKARQPKTCSIIENRDMSISVGNHCANRMEFSIASKHLDRSWH